MSNDCNNEGIFINNFPANSKASVWVVGDRENSNTGKSEFVAERILPGQSAKGDGVIIDPTGKGNLHSPTNYAYKGANGGEHLISIDPRNNRPSVNTESWNPVTHYKSKEMTPAALADELSGQKLGTQVFQEVPPGQGVCPNPRIKLGAVTEPPQTQGSNTPQTSTPLTYNEITAMLTNINLTTGANSQAQSPQSR